MLAAIRRPEGPLFRYLAEEVFGREPAHVRRLMQLISPLGRFTPGLCEALGIEHQTETVSELCSRGLLLRAQTGLDDWFELHQLVRDFVLQSWPLAEAELEELHGQAASWFEENGYVAEALASLVRAEDHTAVARLLTASGADLLPSGRAEEVIAAGEWLPPTLRTPSLERVLGEAYFAQDDLTSALACFERAVVDPGALDPKLGWWIGSVHYNRGDFPAALRTYERTRLGGASTEDAVLLASWSNMHTHRGETQTARALAIRSLESAQAAESDRGLAFAYHALGLVATEEGDLREAAGHYRNELRVAARSDETMQLIRGNNNLATILMMEGRYGEALEAVNEAVTLAELPGQRAVLPYALDTRGRVHANRGLLDDALVDFAAAVRILRARDSVFAADPLSATGDVYRERGDIALARAAYEEAVRLAEPAGMARPLRVALAGLARLKAGEDSREARVLAERAVALGPGEWRDAALLGAGWVALALGDRKSALAFAEEASAETNAEPSRLAESLELRALAAPEPDLSLLEEGLTVWRMLGNPLAEAKVELALGRLGQGAAALELAEHAERRLRRLGVRTNALSAGLIASLPPGRRAAVEIQTLGGLAVFRHGDPVPLGEWKSKKARDLLKLLVARRGRPAPREALMETLWPGDDPTKLSNRLSVALSLLRKILDPDDRFEPDYFVRADQAAVSLERAHLVIDIESFLAESDAALRGDRERLEEAEALYSGEFLEEDAYADWAAPLREEARAVYIQVARALAEFSLDQGDSTTATNYLRRILERDAYDEQAHFALFRCLSALGQHGEARRAYGTYVARMEEIGVEAAPFRTRAADVDSALTD